jgi:hypothetical protein
LDRDAGVLLYPQDDQDLRYPRPQHRQMMEAGVASGAHGNQQLPVVDARLTVMHMEAAGRATGPAAAGVAVQNLVTETGEALSGVSGASIA